MTALQRTKDQARKKWYDDLITFAFALCMWAVIVVVFVTVGAAGLLVIRAMLGWRH